MRLSLALIAGILVVLFWVSSFIIAWPHDYGQWEQQDPKVRSWFQHLMQPDKPSVPCCSFADAYYADIAETENGKLIAVITDDRDDTQLGRPHIPVGTRVEIPQNKIKYDQGNPTGHIVLFIGYGEVFCYVQNGGT